MKKSNSFLSILIPSITVFFSSACIMILELVASRLIARHLGSSLYTWTSVIGVVLAGITIGNYMGGRIADRYGARRTLAVLFGISSLACVLIVVLNNLVGGWMWLWKLSWPAHIFVHVSIVFLLPSILLGTISPVVAKMALDQGLPTGRTVGDIYACGAAGSIAGTFLAGFYLIAMMGTTAIIWTIGAALLVMGILYWARLWVLYIWAAVFIALMTMGMAPSEWAENAGVSAALREEPNPKIIYEDETQYCYVAVARISENPDHRVFMQDKLKHSELVMANVADLKYSYEQIHAAITHRFAADKNRLSVLVIGGGGYVFPRYVEEHWPGSQVDVVEIDPGVTKAAIEAFGLDQNTSIRTFTMDARNYIDQLVANEQNGGEHVRYDFIYEDALNDYLIPFQLVTKEFNDKIAVLLGDEGIYMIEMIDVYNSGKFLGAYVSTLEETFGYVYVITTTDLLRSERNTFVIVAGKRELDLNDLAKDYKRQELELWNLDESEIEQLKANAGNMILTDDYAPVENLMAPVAKRSAIDFLVDRYRTEAQELSKQGKLEASIKIYKDLVSCDPTEATFAYNAMALIFARQGRDSEAIETFRKALKADEKAEIKGEVAGIHYSLGVLLKKVGKTIEAKEHLDMAADLFREGAAGKYANSPKVYTRLGDALAENRNFHEASEAFAKAVALNPVDPAIHMKLIQSLEFQGRFDEAIAASRKAYEIMTKNKPIEAAAKFKAHTEYLIYKKQQQND